MIGQHAGLARISLRPLKGAWRPTLRLFLLCHLPQSADVGLGDPARAVGGAHAGLQTQWRE